MTGRRAAPRGRRNLDELVRLACSTDPLEPERRPRRVALAPRAAMLLGAGLIVLAVLLAVRSVLSSPSGAGVDGAASAAAPGSSAAASRERGTDSAATGSTQAAGAPAPVDPRSGAASGGPGAGTSSGSQVVVHVAGAVREPGVVVLAPGARVDDAIDAAGGLLEDADPDQLNLARVLTDGEQVRVPHVGEDATAWAQGSGTTGGASGASGASGTAGTGATGAGGSGLVDVNTADATALEDLPGIGPALAERIVAYREEHGPFGSLDDLTDVPGIGDAKLEALRDSATVGGRP
ncbi:ComEA family DNA-binding protein [Actinomyces radicidentis]|uniref:ComEA family DNA-binding protein n=1 Tax=Actinomyces radicidentis TaxID=111015 RepID=UPI0028E7F9BD|nr:ComEA family DNA-binding protein [Actinomyces radicidentis]